MRISDWSSDVCSSDLLGVQERGTVRLRDALAQRRAPARKAGRKRDHNRAGAVQPHHHASRRAVVTCWVAARRAGNRPPTKPIASAHFRPVHSTSGETLRSEEHTSELQSLMRNSYAVFCLKKKKY